MVRLIMNPYPPPVDQLLLLGEFGLGEQWHDYRALGIDIEHVPELIRMATDADLVLSADEEDGGDGDEVASWAPEHALRALGQLGAVEAAGPLLEGLDRLIDIHDLWVEDLADVMAALGPEVLPTCESYLDDPSHNVSKRIVVIEVFPKLANAHPEQRGRCIAYLAGQLERQPPNEPDLNGFIVSALIDLKAVEVAPAIEAAFAAGVVDEAIAGGWPDVRYDLGLGPKPESLMRVERRIAELNRGRDTLPDRRRPDVKKLKQRLKRQEDARKRRRKRK